MNIRFLADENIATSLVKSLRKNGFDVKDIKEEKLYGIADKEALEIAKKEDRIVITRDKDFANLLNFPLQHHKGVILLRFSNQAPNNAIKKLIPILKSKVKYKLMNSLVIIGDEFIKINERK